MKRFRAKAAPSRTRGTLRAPASAQPLGRSPGTATCCAAPARLAIKERNENGRAKNNGGGHRSRAGTYRPGVLERDDDPARLGAPAAGMVFVAVQIQNIPSEHRGGAGAVAAGPPRGDLGLVLLEAHLHVRVALVPAAVPIRGVPLSVAAFPVQQLPVDIPHRVKLQLEIARAAGHLKIKEPRGERGSAAQRRGEGGGGGGRKGEKRGRAPLPARGRPRAAAVAARSRGGPGAAWLQLRAAASEQPAEPAAGGMGGGGAAGHGLPAGPPGALLRRRSARPLCASAPRTANK